MTTVTATKEAGALKGSISVGSLKHALKVTGLAIGKGALIPVLQGVRIEQIATGLAVEATDLDLGIRVVLPELGGPAEPIITPHEKFSKWANLLSGDTVQMSATAARATVNCGRAKAVLPLIGNRNWPANEVFDMPGKGITLTQGALARAFTFAQIAIDEKETRPTFTCVQMIGDGTTLRFVATEGHTLVLYTVASEETIDLLVPCRMAKVVVSLSIDEDGGLELKFDDNRILASIDADVKTCVGSKRIVGQFPTNWQAVMPKDKRTPITLNAAELLASLDRGAVLADEKSRYVDMTFTPGEVALHSADDLHGEADETVITTGAFEGEYKTRINSEFLRKLLRKLSGDLTIALPEKSGAPMLFKAQPHEGETLDYIVMPMMRA